jgi:hypothetical protein
MMPVKGEIDKILMWLYSFLIHCLFLANKITQGYTLSRAGDRQYQSGVVENVHFNVRYTWIKVPLFHVLCVTLEKWQGREHWWQGKLGPVLGECLGCHSVRMN